MSTGSGDELRVSATALLGHAWRRTLRTVAGVLLAVYLGWNGYWLAQGELPPSLFLAATGLPCPTTGCTRSLLAWGRGEWMEALRYNPFSLVFVLLFVASGAQVALQLVRGTRPVMAPPTAWCWGICLAAGWIYKLASDPSYW